MQAKEATLGISMSVDTAKISAVVSELPTPIVFKLEWAKVSKLSSLDL